jgi:hypothetical protein
LSRRRHLQRTIAEFGREAHTGAAPRKEKEEWAETNSSQRFAELDRNRNWVVTDNIEADLDITNGARGEIIDIILDPDPEEPPLGDGPIVHLKLPAYVLVKLSRTRASRLQGLGKCVIPIQPAEKAYHVKFPLPDGTYTQRTNRRRQFPMTGAYAFGDYRSQAK